MDEVIVGELGRRLGIAVPGTRTMTRPPELFGQRFTLVEEGNRYGLPAFYELHAWVWKRNPAGVFADYNPPVDSG